MSCALVDLRTESSFARILLKFEVKAIEHNSLAKQCYKYFSLGVEILQSPHHYTKYIIFCVFYRLELCNAISIYSISHNLPT